MRTQIELSNVVAAELAGSQDVVLRALEAHLDCKVYLRGNLLTRASVWCVSWPS
jgi:phosphate starvation-inducible PhoH-like protein